MTFISNLRNQVRLDVFNSVLELSNSTWISKLKGNTRFYARSILESWIQLKFNPGNTAVDSHGSYMEEKAVTATLKEVIPLNMVEQMVRRRLIRYFP